MHIPDFHFDTPIGCDLLAEFGVDRHTVSEVVAEDRATRCPDAATPRFQDPVYPDRGIADLFPQTPHRASAWS